jgi:hypothetical protein
VTAEKEMKKLADFIAENNISMTVKRADSNPNMPDAGYGSFHYKCTLTRTFETDTLYTNRKTGESKPRTYTNRYTLPFTTGSGWTREPSTADVLDCLASDSASIENARSFEDWCSEFGYDEDSRKAEKMFKACERQAHKLKAFLGPNLYEALVWNTERE